MKNIVLTMSLLLFVFGVLAQSKVSADKLIKHPEKVWVFILAGQSNMAGRGKVEAQDTVASPRVLSINAKGEIVPAKEPLNFYETKMQGTGCGLAFGKELLNGIPEDVSILILQTAVGGSSINQWIRNSIHRDVQLFSNFKEKVELGKRYGTVKAILWHQGETDAKPEGIQQRQENLKTLFGLFRNEVGNDSLPILMGELGSYSKTPELFAQMNEQTRLYAASDRFTSVIPTSDFQHRGDFLHFNAAGQREMGKRFAREYVRKFGKEQSCAKKSQPIVVLTFDDAVRSHYTIVAPLLKKYNFGGTFYVCEKHKTGVPDSVNYMSWAQISQLHQMGFEIGNHTGHHKGVGSLTRDQLKEEIRYIEDKCSENGIPKPTTFAYPGNRSDSDSQVVLGEMGYRFARAGGAHLYDPHADKALVIPSHTMATADPKRVSMVWNLLKTLQPGQILVFTIHGVPDNASPAYTTSPDIFTEYLRFMHDHNFKVIALRDLNKYIVNEN